MNIDKVKLAKEVLTKARDQLISEMAACGSHGGVGRVGNQSPTFVAVMNALNFVKAMEIEAGDTLAAESSNDTATTEDVADKMAKLRAAKAAKQINAE